MAESARRHLYLALYGFAVFGWELAVLLALDPLLADRTGDTAAALTHWWVTAVGWAVGAVVVLRLAHREPDRERLLASPLDGHTAARAAAVVVALLVAVLLRLAVTGEWKPRAEWEGLVEGDGELAPIAGAALLLYYACETLVVVTVLACGQRAGELRFGRPAVPWGGLVLALTWGAVHVLLQGPAAGLYAMLAAVLYGVAFSCGDRRLVTTLALVGLAFLL